MTHTSDTCFPCSAYRRDATETSAAAIANIADAIFWSNSLQPSVRVVLIGQVTFINGDPTSRYCTATEGWILRIC